jgi:hypothetical protein
MTSQPEPNLTGTEEKVTVEGSVEDKATAGQVSETVSPKQGLAQGFANVLKARQLGYNGDVVKLFRIKQGDKWQEDKKMFVQLPETKMGRKDEKEALGSPNKNPNTEIGLWVYHSTTLGNLKEVQETGGLDPSKGGSQPGGACHLAPEGKLKETSILNSAGKVSASIERMSMATYLGQKENAIVNPAKGNNDANWAPILLRFKTRAEWKDKWIEDPDDARAWQLKGEKVPSDGIECLVVEGWVPLQTLDLSWVEKMKKPEPAELEKDGQ